MSRKPKWLPNWRNPKAYPDSATSLQWAWEFLRRNPEYQQMWAKLIEPEYKHAAFMADWKNRQAKITHRRTRVRLHQTNVDAVREKFWIETFPPRPSNTEAMLQFKVIRYQVGSSTHENERKKVHGELKSREVVVWFNLDWPHLEQLDNAKLLLETKAGHRGEVFRPRYDHYQRYLRLIDAKSVGASDNLIGKVLYGKLSNTYPTRNRDQRLRDDLDAARKLRDQTFSLVAAVREKRRLRKAQK